MLWYVLLWLTSEFVSSPLFGPGASCFWDSQALKSKEREIRTKLSNSGREEEEEREEGKRREKEKNLTNKGIFLVFCDYRVIGLIFLMWLIIQF